MDLIFYHAGCQDGFAAAFIAKMKYPEAAMKSLSYGLNEAEIDLLMEEAYHKDVLVVDYSFASKDVNEQLFNVAKSLLILDHHISKKENLEGCSYAVFDNERSGCGLAWDYLFGKDSYPLSPGVKEYQPRPWWVRYSEDQDLWKWQLPYSREINAYLMCQPRTLAAWSQIAYAQTDREGMSMACAGGVHILTHSRFMIEEISKKHFETKFAFNSVEYKTAVVNTPTLQSEVGEELTTNPAYKYDIALMWHESPDGLMHFGLRSKHPSKGGTVDVGRICKFFGGGGHFSSGGFETDVKTGRMYLDDFLGRVKYRRLWFDHTQSRVMGLEDEGKTDWGILLKDRQENS